MGSDESPPLEFVFELPELLKGPVELPDEQLVDIGDKVEHQSLGVGRVRRISTYHDDLGILLFVEFPNFQHELLCLDGVKKSFPKEKRAPEGEPLRLLACGLEFDESSRSLKLPQSPFEPGRRLPLSALG